jgi:large subunit ribosomal protein L13
MAMIVVDGTDVIFGRMASNVAKKAMTGEEVHIINAEKLVLNGNPADIAERFLERRRAKHKGNPEYSPKWPRLPHMLVKRMIRGMLPWRTARGKEAYKKIFIYTGNPKELKAGEFKAKKHDGISPHTTVGEICKKLGYRR